MGILFHACVEEGCSAHGPKWKTGGIFQGVRPSNSAATCLAPPPPRANINNKNVYTINN